MPRIRLRTLIVAVAFLALVLALLAQGARSNARERDLRMRLEAVHRQMVGERDRYQRLLENAVISMPPENQPGAP